ncbi:MAG: hypothetical protein J5835_06530 [Bacteroidales bacterium]|nr:hypothetical protein [Bacteroidales bacterium]
MFSFSGSNKSYNVTDFKCHVFRRHNEARPDGNPKCESMEITFSVPGMSDLILYDWYTKGSSMSGTILAKLPVGSETFDKKISFVNARCYALSEEYHIDEMLCRSLHLCLVAEEITIDSVGFKFNKS